MEALAALVGGYLMAIIVARWNLRSRWVRYGMVGIVAALQVGLVLLYLFNKEPPSLEKP